MLNVVFAAATAAAVSGFAPEWFSFWPAMAQVLATMSVADSVAAWLARRDGLKVH